MPQVLPDGTIVCDTPDSIRAFGLLALKGALKLQAVGLSRRGESALSQVKRITGLKASTAQAMVPLYTQWLIDKGILIPKA